MVSKIKRLCKEKSLSIAELQREIGLGVNAIARWDKNRPSVDKVKAVADRLGVTVDELLKEDGND